MVNRSAPNSKPKTVFAESELRVLDAVMPAHNSREARRRSLGDYLVRLARLGGYLNRANDPPPGNTVIWRGMSRLADITFGVLLAEGFVGN